MAVRKKIEFSDGINAYIPLSDLLINLVLVVIVFEMGSMGLQNIIDQITMKKFAEEVRKIDDKYEPRPDRFVRDPQGTQRWRFEGSSLFNKDNSLSQSGIETLNRFKVALDKFRPVNANNSSREGMSWKRIRIEGHVQPNPSERNFDWINSATRAAVVAENLALKSESMPGIQPNLISVSGRGGQNPLQKIILFYENKNDAYHNLLKILKRNKCSYFENKSKSKLNEILVQHNHIPITTNDKYQPVLLLYYFSGNIKIYPEINKEELYNFLKNMKINDRIEIILEYRNQNSN